MIEGHPMPIYARNIPRLVEPHANILKYCYRGRVWPAAHSSRTLSVRRSRSSALLGDREAPRRCGLYWYFARLRGKLDPRSDGGFDPDMSCRSRGRASAPSPTSTVTPDGTSARGLALVGALSPLTGLYLENRFAIATRRASKRIPSCTGASSFSTRNLWVSAVRRLLTKIYRCSYAADLELDRRQKFHAGGLIRQFAVVFFARDPAPDAVAQFRERRRIEKLQGKFSALLPKLSGIRADEIGINQGIDLPGNIAACQRNKISYRYFAVSWPMKEWSPT